MSVGNISTGGVGLAQTSQIRASFQSTYQEASKIIDPEIAAFVKTIGDQLGSSLPSGDIIATALHQLLESKAGSSIQSGSGTLSASKVFIQSQVGDILQGGITSVSELKQLLQLMMDYPNSFEGNMISNISAAIGEFVDNAVTGKPDPNQVQEILDVLAQMVDVSNNNTNLALVKDQLEKVTDKIGAASGVPEGVTDSTAQGFLTPESSTHSVNPISKSNNTFFQTTVADPLNPAALNFDPSDAAEAAQEAGYVVPGLSVQTSAQLLSLITPGRTSETQKIEGMNTARSTTATIRSDALVRPIDKAQGAHTSDKIQAVNPKVTDVHTEKQAPSPSKLLAKPQEVKLELLQKKPGSTVETKFIRLVSSLKIGTKTQLPKDKFKAMMQRAIKILQNNPPDVFQISQGALSGRQLFKRPLDRDRLKKALKQDQNSVTTLLYGALIDVLKGELTEVMLHIPTE